MAVDGVNAADWILVMENYISKVRPPEEIRAELDIGYKIDNQSIFLFEIRPDWIDPTIFREYNYAKATFVKAQNHWKIFWLRASMKWESYQPNPYANQLEDFLQIVERDEYGCFKG
jgi:hypothetical protein